MDERIIWKGGSLSRNNIELDLLLPYNRSGLIPMLGWAQSLISTISYAEKLG